MKRYNYVDLQLVRIDRYELPLNRKVWELARFIENGGTVPPVRVTKSGLGGWRLVDGRHRYVAYKLLGLKKINIQYGE